MADRIYFSCWLKDARVQPLLHQFQRMLEHFPYSRLAKRGPVLRIYALGHAEPPLLEREFPVGAQIEPILNSSREFMAADTACEIDTYWDLWQYSEGSNPSPADAEHSGESEAADVDWKLAPAAVTLACYGPEFDNELGDQLRIEFGTDARFLPLSGVLGGLRMGQSNLKSLLHLVGELERGLSLEKRQVWSESGANFAEVLRQSLISSNLN